MSSYTPGPTGTALLRRLVDGDWHVLPSENDYQSALKLLDRGLLDRHPREVKTFRITGEGFVMLARLAKRRQDAVRSAA